MNITIHKNEAGSFFVLHGEEFADKLTFEEMLGLVAALSMPAQRRCLQWLKTADALREDERGRADRLAAALDAEAAEMGLRPGGVRVAVPPEPAAEPGPAIEPAPIKRSEVNLQVGDQIVCRGGRQVGVVKMGHSDTWPVWTGAFSLTPRGFYYDDLSMPHELGAVQVNGRPIIED